VHHSHIRIDATRQAFDALYAPPREGGVTSPMGIVGASRTGRERVTVVTERRHGMFIGETPQLVFAGGNIAHMDQVVDERSIRNIARFVAPDATFLAPFGPTIHGRVGFLRCVDRWFDAFPDATFVVEDIERQSETTWTLDVLTKGRHDGRLACAACENLRPTGNQLSQALRLNVEIQHGYIVHASLALDVHLLALQLAARE
jgi:hypothetical protein